MRNRRITLLALLLFGCGVLLAFNRYATAKPTAPEETKRKWEYCYLFRSQLSENHYKAQMASPDGRTNEIDVATWAWERSTNLAPKAGNWWR